MIPQRCINGDVARTVAAIWNSLITGETELERRKIAGAYLENHDEKR